MDAEDRKLFDEALRQIAQAHAGASLDDALGELGWSDAFADDPQLAVSSLFERQGAVNATSRALEEVVATAAGLDHKPTTAMLFPTLGHHDAPGELIGAGVVVHGLAGAAGLSSEASEGVVAVVRAGESYAAVTVAAGDLETIAVPGIDRAFGLVRVTTSGPVAAHDAGTAAWPDAVAAAQRALAHELVGVSRTMLQLARDHAVNREQFGRSIATFQAVRHRLSDCVVAIETAAAAAEAAWVEPTPLAATFAKAIAGRSARTVARHAQQVCAGMGFTREHALHHHIRRTLMLDNLFGSSRTLTREIGAAMLDTRRVAPMVPL